MRCASHVRRCQGESVPWGLTWHLCRSLSKQTSFVASAHHCFHITVCVEQFYYIPFWISPSDIFVTLPALRVSEVRIYFLNAAGRNC
jgi:hypothetical protein